MKNIGDRVITMFAIKCILAGNCHDQDGNFLARPGIIIHIEPSRYSQGQQYTVDWVERVIEEYLENELISLAPAITLDLDALLDSAAPIQEIQLCYQMVLVNDLESPRCWP